MEVTKSQQNEIKRTVKKHAGSKVFLFFLIFLLVGMVAGGVTVWQLTKNDVCELNGQAKIVFVVGSGEGGVQTYTEQGIKVVAFGKDVSDTVKIETDLVKQGSTYYINTTEAGVYYVKYSVHNIRFGDVVKYRTIVVEEAK